MSLSRPLEQVTPTKSLIIDSMSCEEKAAHIRNEAVRVLQEGNAMEVGYRYLQSRSGRKTTGLEVLLAAVFATLLIKDFYKNPGYISAIAILFYLAQIFPNVNNRSRYQGTEDACGEWLKKKFGEQEFTKIQAMPYNKAGLDSLTLFLKSKNIPAREKKHEDIEMIQNALMSFTVGYFMPVLTLCMLAVEMKNLITKKMNSDHTRAVQQRPALG